MSGCNGPCNQGRLPCPCPAACGLDEPPQHSIMRVILGDLVIAVLLVAVVVLVVWGVVR